MMTSTEELQGRIRQVEPAAWLVPARILRRVIKKHKGLGGLGLGVPHHKSYIIDRDTLLQIATPAELRLAEGESLPDRVLLLPRPEQALPGPDLLLRYWRQLFHEEIHRTFDRLRRDGKLDPNALQARLHRIGAVPFEEIRDVLRQENLLFAPDDSASVYEEFAAVFLELRHFEPGRVDHYFPALVDTAEVAKFLGEDVDSDEIFRRTRLQGAPDPTEEPPPDVTPPSELPPIEKTTTAPDVIRARAEQVARAGNQVRAALLLERAIAVSPEGDSAALHAAAGAELKSLAGRLQRALGFAPEQLDEWTRCLVALLPAASAARFWNAEVRLLYDLQKACVDMERPLYAADFVEWFVSWFQRPIKRPLPDQPFVLIVKHLRSALGRLPAARMPAEAREKLGELLRSGLHEAERRMRLTFQPQIVESLDKVGLTPQSVAERLSRDQAVEELLDTIGRRGTVSIGDLRDAVARSRLKLPDLSGPAQFFTGDALIRANRELAGQLDGVYRRGEIYLRWLQRLGSLFFGTRPGRLLTLYVILPLLGSLMILKFGEELTHYGGAFAKRISRAVAPPRAEGYYTITPEVDEEDEWDFFDETPVPAPPKPPPDHGVSLFNVYSFFGLAVFLLPVINVPPFRRAVFRVLWYVWVAVRWILYDAPIGFFRLPMVRALFQSPAYLLFWQFVGKPLLWVLPVFLLLLLYRVPLVWALGVSAVLFTLVSVVGNMRLGLVVEEVTADRAVRAWQLVRDDLLPGLFGYFVWLSRFVFDRMERLMYAVDEQLRFRQGQGRFAFVAKLVLGLVWFLFTYLFRLVYNVFFEPQVNPIKHFPVVTVAHKLTFPLIIPAAQAMETQLKWTTERSVAVATGLQLTTPGMWGFLAWELKENWRMYRANQADILEPAVVGGHGEHVINYIRPGFHSGTLPKLFARLRKASGKKHRQAEDGLHHVEEELSHFLHRELFATLASSKRWPKDAAVSVGELDLATNRIRIELCCARLAPASCWLDFTNRGGLLVAGLLGSGWLAALPLPARDALAAALTGFYKRAGVDLVAEQMHTLLPVGARYEVQEGQLLVMAPGLDGAVAYDLEKPDEPPRPALASLPANASAFLFRQRPVRWQDWVEHWRRDAAGEASLPPLLGEMRMLPEVRG